MRFLHARVFTAVLILVLVIASGCLGAVGDRPWATYHRDERHTGQNPDSDEISNPGSINAVWIFPRVSAGVKDPDKAIVDNLNPGFSHTPGWGEAEAPDAYGNELAGLAKSFRFADAVCLDAEGEWTGELVQALWTWPSANLDPGIYQVYVWVPSYYDVSPRPKNAPRVKYQVHDDRGVTTVYFDQSDGGAWKLLSPKFFQFSGMDRKVVVTNETDFTEQEIKDNRYIVVADALKFVPATGQEIYSSPTSAIMDYDARPEINWHGDAPFVFVGTVDRPFSIAPDAPDLGSVYCINSVTPYAAGVGSGDAEKDKLAEKLGTARWKYPALLPDDREELEGPIEGGVYSSPTIAKVGGKLICYVAGMDRQVYALDAETGKLLWKGPGITAGEGNLTSDGWTRVSGSVDAFGGSYHYVKCVDSTSGPTAMAWNFQGYLADTGVPTSTANGVMYAVYVWLPLPDPDDPARIPDAVYTVTYENGETANFTIDQSSSSNQGRWVQLGLSFFNVESVSLRNTTAMENPDRHCVVADACMILPDTIGAFSYSTPVYGKIGSSEMLFAATSGGRVVAFDATPKASPDPLKYAPIAATKWIYPRIRTKLDITDPSDLDADPLGEIGASPAFANERLYVASFDGNVRALKDLNTALFASSATTDWFFPNGSDSGETVAGFTSSPTIYAPSGASGSELYIGSTGGVFYCLHAAKQEDPSDPTRVLTQLKWRYPGNPSDPVDPTNPDQGELTPLGAFRYSTPTVTKVNHAANPRVWCGSTDGKVYSFDTSPTATDRRVWVEFNADGSHRATHGPDWYYEPQVGSPIQGAIAFDAGDSGGRDPTMFVGDMRGTLHWYNARTGNNTAWTYKGWRTEGELFSSPNVTNFKGSSGTTSSVEVSWIYVGASDGRLYAFSNEGGAWDGEWRGGVWPFEGGDNEGRGEKVAGPDTEVQFEIFPADFAGASEKLNPERTEQVTTGTPPVTVTKYLDCVWYDDPGVDNGGNPGDPCVLGDTMKIIPSSVVPTLTTDDEIDAYLLKEAKVRRNYAFEGANRARNSTPMYFEWGETINIILWNLPDWELITGSKESEKRNSIKFNFANTSAGENAGSQIRLTGNIKFLKSYTVLDGTSKTGSGDTAQYVPLTYSGNHSDLDRRVQPGTQVKRCYALGQIEIRPTSSRPPSPGPGWLLTATVASEDNKGIDQVEDIPLATLKPGTGSIKYEPVLVSSTSKTGPLDKYKEQMIGINNPLAIRDDGDRSGLGQVTELAWPALTTGTNAFTTENARNDPDAHYNGNAVANADGTRLATGIIPTLSLNLYDQGRRRGVPHGTSSREGWLGVMDRSATGCNVTNASTTPPTTSSITRFRINSRELRWRGDVPAIGNSGGMQFPWDQGPGSVDYPNIYQRSQGYRKASDDADPTTNSATLPPLILLPDGTGWGTNYGGSPAPRMRPDTVFVSVDVPRFQPANGKDGDKPTGGSRYDLSGYSRTAHAYVDSDGNREFQSGNTVRGRPSTYQEAYREFKMWLTVPADPRMEVEEQTIDIGRAPHGLGQALEGTPLWFQAYNPNPLIRQWFKKLTVKNSGNVNLHSLRVAKRIADMGSQAYDLGLLSDQVNPTAPLPATTIVSSLDGDIPVFNTDPFATNSASGFGMLGYTLSKPRVGDPDPTILTVPDRRKWDFNYSNTRILAQDAMRAFGWNGTQPLAPYVSVQVPITQPIGTYVSYNPVFRDYTIPVFSDRNGDGTLQLAGAIPEPFAAPSFQVKVTVKESQLTGGVTPTTLPQIDSPTDSAVPPRVGDATPAAFKDADTGSVHLVWSSNRMFEASHYPDWTNDSQIADFANAPWFLSRAALEWDNNASNKGWLPVQAANSPAERWWRLPATDKYLPASQWPKTSDLVPWGIGGSDTGLYQVRHYSPTFAENLSVSPSADSNRTWLAWAGSADRLDSNNKVLRDYMLFYTDATHGDLGSDAAPIYSILQTPGAPGHDPSTEKRYPSLSVYDDKMWMFWQGGQKGAWSIYFASQQDSSGKHDSTTTPWSADTKLRTPDCLATVSSPNAIYRKYWDDLTGSSGYKDGPRDMFDVVYSGTSKLRQNSDILLGKYCAITSQTGAGTYHEDTLPGRGAIRMPRVFGEKLERDPKYGFFTSQHLAWVRLESSKLARREQRPVIDDWGMYNPDPNDATYDPDLPYIHVILPEGYADADGNVWANGAIVSATDGSIYEPGSDGSLKRVVAPAPIFPQIDDATGIYTFKYPDAKTAGLLGDMLIDFSEGIVRFTKALVERPRDDGGVSAPEIYADYTPQTWRLTTDMAGDSSSRAFIERTRMHKAANPGLCEWDDEKPAPVDRLWVLWRKSGTGIESSTIFYRTFRIGVDVTELFDDSKAPAPPMKMNPDGSPAKIAVTGNLGPFDVDRAGRIISFTGVDERYRSMFTPQTSTYFGNGPAPITITYTGTDNKEHVVEAEDIFWRTELAEQSLFGYSADTNVNEGSIYAFADPKPMYMSSRGTFAPLPTSKIWVFWTSTRGGTSDLFWETLSPNFAAR